MSFALMVGHDGKGVYVGQDLGEIKREGQREREREEREGKRERERMMVKGRKEGSWEEGGRREGKNFTALAAAAPCLS